jgi:Fur family ferric uptake transcriptional regulator
MPPVEEARRRLDAFMAERGLKHTRQRDEVLGAFFESSTHVSVDELLRRVQVRDENVGAATVYRALKLFAEAGIAHESHFGDGQARYEPMLADQHHDHLICSDCGRIVEFHDPVIEARQVDIAREHGLAIRAHRLDIYGRCASPETCRYRVAK